MNQAYGGVVINVQGQVLLREPSGHYDGYVWTFAKGRPDEGETPEQTALREVEEKTGVVGKIITPIPGEFRGATTINEYFPMTVVEDTEKFEDETRSVRWVAESEARELIAQTTNERGKKRDLRFLEAAYATFRDPIGVNQGPGQKRTEWHR